MSTDKTFQSASQVAKAEDQKKFTVDVNEDEMLDISTELWREYHYPEGVTLHIQDPVKLHIRVSDKGNHSHRIIDARGHGWYIKPGWLAIEWNNHLVEKRISF